MGEREPAGRPAVDRLELAVPALTRLVTRAVLAAPGPVRIAVLRSAFDRARDAFNRGDLEVVFAAFAADVEYIPPPPLSGPALIRGKVEVMRYWTGVFEHYETNRIENLEVVESGGGVARRTARLRHGSSRDPEALDYAIVQTTRFDRGEVVRQENLVDGRERRPGSLGERLP